MYVILLLLLFLPDIYISRNYIHEPIIMLLYWLPSLIAIIAVIALWNGSSRKMIKTLFLIILLLGVPKLIFTIVSFLGWPLGMAYPPLMDTFNIIGIIMLAITAFCMLYGITLGWQWFRVDKKSFTFSNLPKSFDGFKIVQISDLHLGTFGKRRAFCRKLVQAVNKENADLIVFTGDIVNSRASEIKPFISILPRLKSSNGVLSILGNHDYCVYADFSSDDEMNSNIDKIIKTEKEFGWDVLINENRRLDRNGECIYILGVENNGKPPFPMRADLNKAMENIPKDAFKILLSHDPTHWRQEVLPKTNIDLTLSGHTHGMQFSLFGFNPSFLVYREWGGVYKEKNQVLHVSLGIGGNMAFRFGAWAEFNVLTLNRT